MPERVRHIKRGTEYTVICAGKIQTDRPLSDYAEVTVYKGEDGMVWVRPIDEFEDPKRFENLRPAPPERAVVQGYSQGIPWSIHCEAWDVYAKRYGTSQSAQRIHDRGGFSAGELDMFIPGWRDRVSELTSANERIAELESENDRLRVDLKDFCVFQARVDKWLIACFGEEIARDKIERNHRFLEESLELVQALGCTQSEAHQLVDYVFGREEGEAWQEVGGVMNTLAALCCAHALDLNACGERELARVWTKLDQIREKQKQKPKHSPLPGTALQEKPANE